MTDAHPVWSFIRNDYQLIAMFRGKDGPVRIFHKDGMYFRLEGQESPRRISKEMADDFVKLERNHPIAPLSPHYLKEHASLLAKFERSGQHPDNEYEVYEAFDHCRNEPTYWLVWDGKKSRELPKDEVEVWTGFAEAAGRREWRA